MVSTVQFNSRASTRRRLNRPSEAPAWPPGAELVLSAIDAGQYSRVERRFVERSEYRVAARLKLFSDPADSQGWELYTRDANQRGMGFITPHRLPLGYGGLLEIVVPDGATEQIACTLLRCREAAPGWFEGALYFNRQQIDFAI